MGAPQLEEESGFFYKLADKGISEDPEFFLLLLPCRQRRFLCFQSVIFGIGYYPHTNLKIEAITKKSPKSENRFYWKNQKFPKINRILFKKIRNFQKYLFLKNLKFKKINLVPFIENMLQCLSVF